MHLAQYNVSFCENSLRPSGFLYPSIRVKKSLHLRHSSFSNPSVALPTSQLILQPFFPLHLCHRLFTYVSWRAAPAFVDALNTVELHLYFVRYFLSVENIVTTTMLSKQSKVIYLCLKDT